jgi:phosphatidylserine/phosphatidylglycerophosphate/cardiolipin synthase-like enzyme
MAAAMRSNFHPKCLLVDGEEALVTSANFTMAAQKKNVEVGVKTKAPIARLQTYFFFLVERGDFKRIYLPTDSSWGYDSTLRRFSWISRLEPRDN